MFFCAIYIMDAKLISDLLTHSDNNLTGFVESERDTYLEVEDKINRFFSKGGLNIVLITGLRGTGKTTILKTLAKKYNGLYAGGDFLKTKSILLEDLTKVAKAYDKKIVIVDEILYLSDWQTLLKIEADSNVKILYLISGSSAMQLKKISQDLSRRLDIYKLNPLSFKEFLRLKYKQDIDINIDFGLFENKDINKLYLKLSEVHRKLSKNIAGLFKEYYDEQFPFLFEEKHKKDKLLQMIEKIIYKDLPQIENLFAEHLKNAELIVKFLSSAEKVNYTNIASNLGMKKDLVIKIVDLLEKSELLYLVQDVLPTRELRGNKKILFSAPSIRSALNEVNDTRVKGFSREDMFGLIMKILNVKFGYNYAQDGFDFLARNINFEIGNNKKKLKAGTIVVGDFVDLDLKNKVLFVPFSFFALIQNKHQNN